MSREVQYRRFDGVRALGRQSEPTLVAIGNFDGVHAGHRAVLGAASRDAASRGLVLCVLTFHPHPTEVLGRGKQAVLTPIDRKIELLARVDSGIRVVVEPFTRELAAMTPRAFAEELLAGPLSARVVMVGQNFRFGHERAGDLRLLAELGDELGFQARAEPLRTDAEGPISSSRIRASIAAGDLGAAESWLGRPHALSGSVVHGDGRGRTIGVPTANLGGVVEALPPHGVYACVVDQIRDGAPVRLSTGVVNIGTRPTVAAGFSVEVHLHDFESDLYGTTLRLHLVGHIRAEKKFESLEALVTQIREDIATARQLTAGRTPDPAAGAAWY
jgi:riboflavin kinase/FMN adenylyltransferase